MLEIAFRHRSSLVLVLVWPVLAWTVVAPPATPLFLGLGAALLVAGACLRLAAARCLGKGARVHRAGAREGVVDWGPYAWSRNPLYIAAGLILAGFSCLAGGEWLSLLLLPGTCLVYMPVVIHEEASIRAGGHEEYASYLTRVPRWIGLPRRAEETSPTRSPWSEVFRREKGLIPGLVLSSGAIVLAQRGIVPLRSLFESAHTATGVPPAAAAAVLLAVGAVINSVGIERKRHRREARRAAQAAAAAAAGDGDPSLESASAQEH
ncbi:MAG: isoprenylcysteine carboxylmethyltransferase family protein [Planctomycetes bacterium]|nr:isoprenylcysteine carboxylmethyltransferase family protein [Planctomycetota bacterium]